MASAPASMLPRAPEKKKRGTRPPTIELAVIPSKMRVDPIETLVTGLMNHMIIKTVESKDGSIVTRSIPDAKILEARALMRSFFPAGKTYRFRLTSTFAPGTNGAGALVGFQSFSPAVTTYNEWSAVSALFDEVRGLKNQLTLISSFGPTSTAIVAPISIAPDYSLINTTPSSAVAVNRLAESVVLPCGQMTTGKGIRLLATMPSELEWCQIATPATVSPYAGCVGQWSFYASTTLTASIVYYYAYMDFLVQLRCRA